MFTKSNTTQEVQCLQNLTLHRRSSVYKIWREVGTARPGKLGS